MNILDKIVRYKRKEVIQRKNHYPAKILERTTNFQRKTYPLADNLVKNYPGILAEFKRKSPSAGMLNDRIIVEEVIKGYIDSGAAALSVLTDHKFFGGSLADLEAARNNSFHPILRKDFILDEYQVIEAKAAGADAILLIAEILTKDQVRQLSVLARSLSLEVVLEIHYAEQLTKLCDQVNIVGVNNRDLENLTVDVDTSFKLAGAIPDNFLRISESGINSPDIIRKMIDFGYHGFLIGEYFMKHRVPQEACKKLIENVLGKY